MSFIKSFDPMNADHVKWLKKMTDLAEIMGDPTKQYSLLDDINSNPMGLKLSKSDVLNWVEIHFGIAMKYTQAVLKSQAIVPGTGLTPIE
jgi:hypothetical protein